MTLDRLALALVEQIAMYVAQTGDARQHAGAVRVAQAALDAVFGKDVSADSMERLKLLADGADHLGVHLFHLVDHGWLLLICVKLIIMK